MPLDFTALDFETANGFRGSACAVGLVKVRGGVVVDEVHWLIRPPEPFGWFASYHTQIHGITADDVADQPGWLERLPDITRFIGDDVVVAHNAGFDVGVMREACNVYGVPYPSLDFLCSMVLARRALSLPSYQLPYVADVLQVPLGRHHHALDDARCTAAITNALARRVEATTIHELAAAYQVVVGHMEGGVYRSSVTRSGALIRPELNQDADPEGPLYGKVVVFTGALSSMRRQDAWTLTAHVGGIPEKNVTKRTNILVVGDLNPAHLRPGEHLSSKARRAFELQDAGQEIEVMTEMDFIRALQGGREDIWEVITDQDEPPAVPILYRGPRRPLDTTRLPGEDYWAWFERVLRHPDGRATGGEPCDHCGEPVPAKAPWQYRDRHVCSSRCNLALIRRFKKEAGIRPGQQV